MKQFKLFLLSLILSFSIACQQETSTAAPPDPKADPHSSSQPNEARTTHLDLHLKGDFDKKNFSGYARWTIENKTGATEIIFDTDNIHIEKITLGKEEKPAEYFLVARDSVLGSALKVPIEPGTDLVTIYYSTGPNAPALGWMEPSMTAGKKLPFLFTQGQAILTRSWIPCQDTPANRITYTASIEVPLGMMAVMSAENPQQKSADGQYRFLMEQPIAPYLIALAVGDIAFRPVGQRTGVYAEPAMLDKVAWEFTDMEKMVTTAESLYGPYAWGRYDLIVLPTGFPFGGMENPRLTFATPTVITGDRSMVSLVAHELAHSWSGNLVTNATWNDFWLNEGFTVYFERRIMEALYGKEYTEMLAQLEYWELLDEVKTLGDTSPDTRLKVNLAGRNPDDGVGDVAYQKGSSFLVMLERLTDRTKWDEFLKSWFDTNKFQSKTTEEFLTFLQKNYLEKYGVTANVDEWVYHPGLPANYPKPNSARLANVEKAAVNVATVMPDTKDWTPHEWVHFVRNLPENTDVVTLKKLDKKFHLTTSGNAEIKCAWYEVAIRQGYSPEILPQIEYFLLNTGRRRFLMPIYTAFKEVGRVETARRIFEKAKPGYHAVSRGSVEELLK
ncbi:MAG: M1 family metallopeptidase [Bacteroidetes bacterium]|nr:M1 family metallopeptidase [Bacteroidota bacterium]